MTIEEARDVLDRVVDAASRYTTAAMNAAACQTRRDFRLADEARDALEETIEREAAGLAGIKP